MDHYQGFIKNLKGFVFEYWGKGRFKDKRTDDVYKYGILDPSDGLKVRFISESSEKSVIFSFDDLNNLEQIEAW